MKPVKTAVVGCGKISDIYFENMINRFDSLDVAACCALHLENAQRKAQQYGIEARTYEEILADPSFEMIVNLTPARDSVKLFSVDRKRKNSLSLVRLHIHLRLLL